MSCNPLVSLILKCWMCSLLSQRDFILRKSFILKNTWFSRLLQMVSLNRYLLSHQVFTSFFYSNLLQLSWCPFLWNSEAAGAGKAIKDEFTFLLEAAPFVKTKIPFEIFSNCCFPFSPHNHFLKINARNAQHFKLSFIIIGFNCID